MSAVKRMKHRKKKPDCTVSKDETPTFFALLYVKGVFDLGKNYSKIGWSKTWWPTELLIWSTMYTHEQKKRATLVLQALGLSVLAYWSCAVKNALARRARVGRHSSKVWGAPIFELPMWRDRMSEIMKNCRFEYDHREVRNWEVICLFWRLPYGTFIRNSICLQCYNLEESVSCEKKKIASYKVQVQVSSI